MVMSGCAWLEVCRYFWIESHNSEAHQQNENSSEHRGGILKYVTVKLYHYGHKAPLEFWCYALEYLALVWGCLD